MAPIISEGKNFTFMTEPRGYQSPRNKVSSFSPSLKAFSLETNQNTNKSAPVISGFAHRTAVLGDHNFSNTQLVLTALTSAASTGLVCSLEFSVLADLHSWHSLAVGQERGNPGALSSAAARLAAERGGRGLPGSGGRHPGAAAVSGSRATERDRLPQEGPRHRAPPQEGFQSEVALHTRYLAASSEPSARRGLFGNGFAPQRTAAADSIWDA